MTGRLWGDRRAEAFQNALDGHVDLAEHELTEFVHLAHTLREMPSATLGDEARSSMRARLVAEAESVLGTDEAPAPPQRSRRRRSVRAAAGSTAALAALSAGVVTVSADALPGDVLYPIKRGVEQLELTFGGGGASAGNAHLDHASTRLDEATALARSGGSSDQIADALNDFTADTRLGTEQLLRSYTSDRDPIAIQGIRSFTNPSGEQLHSLAPMLGESTDSAYIAAVDAVESADRRAIEACPECSGGPAVQVPYRVDPIGRIDALPQPDRDGKGGNDSEDYEHDDIFAEPQDLPRGTDIPPLPDKQDQFGDSDDHSAGPKLQGGSGSDNGSSGVDKDKLDPDKGKDEGEVELPDLPTLPDADDVIGGDIDLRELEKALGPVRELLNLGPLGDLLDPLLGTGSDAKPDKNGSRGPLDGLLGPLLGGNSDETDKNGKPDKNNSEPEKVQPDSGSTEGDDQGQQNDDEQDKGPADDLVGPVEETDEAPDVDKDPLGGLTGKDEGDAEEDGLDGLNGQDEGGDAQ